MTYHEWALVYPEAARMLGEVLAPAAEPPTGDHRDKSEGWAQQQARFRIAEQGAMSWRNNVGATKAKCPDCGVPRQPVRYGLCNDSTALNEKIKSHDLILAIPRLITPVMVGTTIAQFGSVEVKEPGWTFTGKGREGPQAAWGALILRAGGYATFSTGEINL